MERYDDREIVSNTLMHREYTSSYAAKLVIKKDQLYTENANRADRLGSGVHKLFKYTKFYSGKDPVFEEGDVFRIVVPLDDAYSFDMEIDSDKGGTIGTNDTIHGTDARRILDLIKQNPEITQKQMQEETELSLRTVKRILAELQKSGKLIRQGNNRSGKWQIQE